MRNIEKINEIIKIIRMSSVTEKQKDDLTFELLNMFVGDRERKEVSAEEKTETNQKSIEQKKLNGNLLNPKEEQMVIELPGVSVNSIPRKDGRFQGYLIDGDGKKKYIYGRSYKDVTEKIQIEFRLMQNAMKRSVKENLERKEGIIKKFENSKKKAKEVHPFNEYLEGWIEKYKAPNVKPTTLQSIRTAVKPALIAFGETPIEEITGDDIQDLLIHIQATRLRDLCKINLSQVFKKATIQKIIDSNPCESVEIKKHKSEHKKALTIEEQRRFLIASENSPHSLLFRLILSTGIRIGEALALTKADIDFENCKLTINKNVAFINGKRIVQDTPKSEAGNRIIPIPADICRELKEIQTENLFPCTYNAAKKALEKIAKGLDIKMTLHTLCHTYATRLEEAGIPAKVKQYLLGHASLEMTQNTYTDTQTAYIDSVSDKVRAVFADTEKQSRPGDLDT